MDVLRGTDFIRDFALRTRPPSNQAILNLRANADSSRRVAGNPETIDVSAPPPEVQSVGRRIDLRA